VDTIFVAIPAAAAASFLAAREGWRAWQPARHLLAGRYTEAQDAADELERSWMRIFPGLRVSARYAAACALHLRGELEASLEATASIPRPHDADALDAATLILLDREPVRALSLIEPAARMPEDRLLVALARQRLERTREESEELDEESVTGDRAAIFYFLRGLYRIRAGQDELAKIDLRRAADAPHANVYTRRARALLEERPVDEGTSSLAPHAVAKALGPGDGPS